MAAGFIDRAVFSFVILWTVKHPDAIARVFYFYLYFYKYRFNLQVLLSFLGISIFITVFYLSSKFFFCFTLIFP